MSGFDTELRARLELLKQQNLRRTLRRIDAPQQPVTRLNSQLVLNFSSNDYLALANHPNLRDAAQKAIRDYGVGSGASRLICGSLEPHHRLEEELAEFKGVERALVFSSGYATATGTIPALVSSGDIVVLDKLVHASIVDGARLSGAKLRVFQHNDLNDLERILGWATQQRGASSQAKILVITESLFSMDGDFAPLQEITQLKDRYGAWLMVDEAHATGLFGKNRRGLVEEFGLGGRVEVQMGTLGKALGVTGGYIAGSTILVDYLINRARSFIFSTAPPPAISAACLAALEIVRSQFGAELLARLRANIKQFCAEGGICALAADSPIIPKMIGPEEGALRLAKTLLDQGFLVPAIRYPTVARGAARLRFTISAAHTQDQITSLSSALGTAKE